MIVYGDPAYEADLNELTGRLTDRLESVQHALAAAPNDGLLSRLARLDALRSLLVQAGQLEQAAADAHPDFDELQSIEAVNSHIADAFVAYYGGAAYLEIVPALQLARNCLNSLPPLPRPTVNVKIPEGFAFYTLYPDQYIQAALDWMHDHSGDPSRGSVAVVGIRSIGTALSAVVTNTLVRHGWSAHRLTVRPSGHPFKRWVDVEPCLISGAAYGLVADEGPGLSGSSMAAAAAALERIGIDRRNIAFLPGHPHDPGNAASSEVQGWWASTPRYAKTLDQLRWDGYSLEELIAKLTPHLLGFSSCAEQVENFSTGRWREAVYQSPAEWPAVCGMFERTKYRCVCGSGASAIWKFSGFADLPGSPPSQTRIHGFEVTRWVDGRPLRLTDVNDSVLEHIAQYMVQSAGPIMSPVEHRAARARLENMLVCNTREALGEEAAAHVESWSKHVDTMLHAMPAHTDGHMAPHEWLQTPSGHIVKVDCTGHMVDHTTVGAQPLLWDTAGAIVEWDLDEVSARPLLRAWRDAGLPPFLPSALAWYQMAYAAFRLGLFSMCRQAAGGDSDSQEGLRLHNSMLFYEQRLRGALQQLSRTANGFV